MFFGFCFSKPDILRGSRYDIDEKTLMFFVIIGEKAANGIDSSVLEFEQATEVGIRTSLFSGVVHSGYGLFA